MIVSYCDWHGRHLSLLTFRGTEPDDQLTLWRKGGNQTSTVVLLKENKKERRQKDKNLKDPVCTAQKPCNTQCKHIMSSEWLNNLQNRIERKVQINRVIVYYSTDWSHVCLKIHLGILHQAQLRQHWNSFQINTEGPAKSVHYVVRCCRMGNKR